MWFWFFPHYWRKRIPEVNCWNSCLSCSRGSSKQRLQQVFRHVEHWCHHLCLTLRNFPFQWRWGYQRTDPECFLHVSPTSVEGNFKRRDRTHHQPFASEAEKALLCGQVSDAPLASRLPMLEWHEAVGGQAKNSLAHSWVGWQPMGNVWETETSIRCSRKSCWYCHVGIFISS